MQVRVRVRLRGVGRQLTALGSDRGRGRHRRERCVGVLSLSLCLSLRLRLCIVDLAQDQRVLDLELLGLEVGIGGEALDSGVRPKVSFEDVPLNRAQLTSSSFSLALRIALSNSVSLWPSFWKAAKMEVRLGVNVGGLTEVGETACFATSTAGAVILSVVIPG